MNVMLVLSVTTYDHVISISEDRKCTYTHINLKLSPWKIVSLSHLTLGIFELMSWRKTNICVHVSVAGLEWVVLGMKPGPHSR